VHYSGRLPVQPTLEFLVWGRQWGQKRFPLMRVSLQVSVHFLLFCQCCSVLVLCFNVCRYCVLFFRRESPLNGRCLVLPARFAAK